MLVGFAFYFQAVEEIGGFADSGFFGGVDFVDFFFLDAVLFFFVVFVLPHEFAELGFAGRGGVELKLRGWG